MGEIVVWLNKTFEVQDTIGLHVETYPNISQSEEFSNQVHGKAFNYEKQLTVYDQRKSENSSGHTSWEESNFFDATQVNDEIEGTII